MDIFSETVKWKELAPLPVCRTAHTAVLLKGNIYVGGGLEGTNSNDQVNSCRLDVYNLTTNQWSSSPITAPYYWSAMTVLDDKLIIAGGETKNDEVVKKVLVLNAGHWKDLSEMPTARSYATAVGYHSMLIVVGGRIKVKGEWTRSSTTEMLDTISGYWHTCSNLPCPHQRMKAAVLNDQLYLLSGVDQDLKLSTQVFVASLDTISTYQLNWQSAPNTPWCSSAPVVLYKKFLLTLGGCHQSRTSEVNIFSPSNLHYKCLANTRIPAPRSSSAVVSLADNITVVIGGTTDNGKRTKKTWIGTFE